MSGVRHVASDHVRIGQRVDGGRVVEIRRTERKIHLTLDTGEIYTEWRSRGIRVPADPSGPFHCAPRGNC